MLFYLPIVFCSRYHGKNCPYTVIIGYSFIMATTLSSTIKSVNPANLNVLAEVQIVSAQEVDNALKKAQESFLQWSSLSLKERLSKIANFQQLLLRKKDDIAQLISTESGKPIVEAYLAEISGVLDVCNWLQKQAINLLGSTEINISHPLLWGKKHYLEYEPLGVIGIISPWNYPFSIPLMTILMALAAGNAVILKPSEKTPLIGLKIGELFEEAGFPQNIVSVITGGAQAGETLAKADLARIIVTGSVSTGIKVAEAAASQLTPVSLELGGKDAAIVLPDAPVERTARAITWGAFTNAGQACASIERLYVVRGGNSDLLVDRIVQLVGQLKVDDPLLESTEVGPLIDVQQFDHVVNLVEQAVHSGAQIMCGGAKLNDHKLRDKGLSGYFYQPTVITNVDHSMAIMQEEIFGPVLPIMVVNSVDEAIKLANDSQYALSASVWSENIPAAVSVANKIKAGSVFINDALYSHVMAELPWGGLKKSGFGKSHSSLGMLDLVNVKHVSIDTLSWAKRMWWYPYNAAKLKTISYGLEYLYSKNAKLSNLYAFLKSMITK